MANRYLHKFESEAARDAVYLGNNYEKPWVSYTTDKYMLADTEHSGGDLVKCNFIGVKQGTFDEGQTFEDYNIFYNEDNNEYVGYEASADFNPTEAFWCFPMSGENTGKFEVCGSCPCGFEAPVNVEQVDYNKRITLKVYYDNQLLDTLVLYDNVIPESVGQRWLGMVNAITLGNDDRLSLDYNSPWGTQYVEVTHGCTFTIHVHDWGQQIYCSVYPLIEGEPA